MPTRTADPKPVILSGTPPDKWRWTCPRGHHDVDRCNDHWWCRSCADAERHGADIDPEFDVILDNQTGRELSRDEVKFADDWPL